MKKKIIYYEINSFNKDFNRQQVLTTEKIHFFHLLPYKYVFNGQYLNPSTDLDRNCLGAMGTA